eukprot:5310602-Amphidinium_carterae.1
MRVTGPRVRKVPLPVAAKGHLEWIVVDAGANLQERVMVGLLLEAVLDDDFASDVDVVTTSCFSGGSFDEAASFKDGGLAGHIRFRTIHKVGDQ